MKAEGKMVSELSIVRDASPVRGPGPIRDASPVRESGTGKVVFGDFMEFIDPVNKLGNYHYARLFAEDGYDVLWMSCPWNASIFLKDREAFRIRRKLSKPGLHVISKAEDATPGHGGEPGCRNGRIFGYAPYCGRLYGNYPFAKNPARVFKCHRHIRPDIMQTMQSLGFDRAEVLWISNPKQYWLTEVIEYKKLIYRIPDDFTGHPGFPDSISVIENALIDKADHIFVTSENLIHKVSKRGKRAEYLPNGADFEHFSRPSAKPPEYEGIQRPILIYAGAVSNWFDEELISELAAQVDSEIFIVGRGDKPLNQIKGLKNVHILGGRPYSEIPSYMNWADAALIPFIKNSFTDAISPIKLFEYCSAGVGVVSTALDQVIKLNAPIRTARSRSDFITAVGECLRKPCDRTQLMEFGRKNSWKDRYENAKGAAGWKSFIR